MYSPPSSNGVYDSSANPTASADEFCQERGWDYPVGNPIIGSWEDGKREGGLRGWLGPTEGGGGGKFRGGGGIFKKSRPLQ